MKVWKMIFLPEWVICRFHVNLPGCIAWKHMTTKKGSHQENMSHINCPMFVKACQKRGQWQRAVHLLSRLHAQGLRGPGQIPRFSAEMSQLFPISRNDRNPFW